MTYHPHDDLPDDPVYPSLPGHEPDVRPFPRIGLSPTTAGPSRQSPRLTAPPRRCAPACSETTRALRTP